MTEVPNVPNAVPNAVPNTTGIPHSLLCTSTINKSIFRREICHDFAEISKTSAAAKVQAYISKNYHYTPGTPMFHITNHHGPC
jgi:hypothetical protein